MSVQSRQPTVRGQADVEVLPKLKKRKRRRAGEDSVEDVREEIVIQFLNLVEN